MPSLASKIANQVLRAYCRLFFRPGTPYEVTRSRFEKVGVSKQRFQRKFPKATFQEIKLGGVSAERIQAREDSKKGALLYFHGGGYFFGSVHTHRGFGLRLSYHCEIPVYVVEYRLAPENPFPAAIDDALASYLELRKQEEGPIVVGGDSAGGGLTLALVHRLKKENQKLPDAIFALSPWTDLTNTVGSRKSNNERDAMFRNHDFSRWASFYVGQHEAKDPLLSPLHGDFAGFPPTLIQVGEFEILLDDSRLVAEKAKAAGVDVTFEEWEGMQHTWQLALAEIPESKQAVQNIKRFVQRWI